MCMKNLNATIEACVNISNNHTNNSVLSYNNIFDIIYPEREEEGKFYFSKFDVIINMVAIFKENDIDDSCINIDKQYDCMLSVSSDGETLEGIRQFKFNTYGDQKIDFGDRKIFHSTNIMKEIQISIPQNASHFDLVLLIKNPPNDGGKWVLQTLKRFFINKI